MRSILKNPTYYGAKVNGRREIIQYDNQEGYVTKDQFYSFIYDYGYWGVVALTALMAIIAQKAYLAAMRSAENKTQGINLVAVVYSYMYFTLLFSFFSNKFYEMMFSVTFLYYLLYWWLLKVFLEKV